MFACHHTTIENNVLNLSNAWIFDECKHFIRHGKLMAISLIQFISHHLECKMKINGMNVLNFLNNNFRYNPTQAGIEIILHAVWFDSDYFELRTGIRTTHFCALSLISTH